MLVDCSYKTGMADPQSAETFMASEMEEFLSAALGMKSNEWKLSRATMAGPNPNELFSAEDWAEIRYALDSHPDMGTVIAWEVDDPDGYVAPTEEYVAPPNAVGA